MDFPDNLVKLIKTENSEYKSLVDKLFFIEKTDNDNYIITDLDTNEKALAKALMSIYENGVHDFKDVAAALSSMKVIAPRSGLKDWTIDLLHDELIETNNKLDLAYRENGFGA
jgi:hypothetical protein